MKLCLKEIMKRIALLEQQKAEILSDEAQNCTTTYGLGEEGLPAEYDFASARAAVKAVDNQVRYLRHQLNLANATVTVPEFNMNIGECIVLMAQLGKEREVLEKMARRQPKARTSSRGYISDGRPEWTETNYSQDECRNELKRVVESVTKLQLALDRTNLTHEIEVDCD